MNNPELKQQVDNRRTFAIISHPDAGKTTITEQLLLFGGAIRQKQVILPNQTGWKSRNNVEYLSLVLLCSLIIKENE